MRWLNRHTERLIFNHSYSLNLFAKLRKATISSVMSVCLSVRSSVRTEQLRSHWMDFHDTWYVRIFRRSVEKIGVSLKYEKRDEYFIWKPMYIHDKISLISHLYMLSSFCVTDDPVHSVVFVCCCAFCRTAGHLQQWFSKFLIPQSH